MPKFEEFLYKNQEERKQFTLDRALDKYSTSENDYAYGIDQLEEKIKARISDKNTLEERTEYYFKDTGMLNAKVNRYRSLSDDAEEADRYSKEYGNKKASSRMAAAGKAGEYFELARNEIKGFDEKDKDPYEIFKHRAKVMELRLKGRKEAAKAKAKSKEHESYLTDKATLSCMMILREQLENLRDETKDKKLVEKFNKKQDELDRMIESAKDRLARSGKSAARIWQESGTGEDNLFDKTFKNGKYHDLAASNPALTEDGARLLITLMHMDEHKPQWPLRVVLKTKGGTCVTQGEKEKDEINQKFTTTQSQQEKEDIMRAALKRVESFVIPQPKELSAKTIVGSLNKGLSDFYDVICVALPHLLNAEEGSFEKRYIDENPKFKDKLTALSTYSNLVNEYLKQNGIEMDADGKFKVVEVKKKEEKKKEEKKPEVKKEDKKKIEKIEKTLMEQYNSVKNLTDLTVLPKGKNDRFNEDDFFRFRQLQRNVSVFNTTSHIKKIYRNLYKEVKSELMDDRSDRYATELTRQRTLQMFPTYFRAVSVVLDNVGDVNKKETRKKNRDRIKILTSGNNSAIVKLLKSSATKIFDNVKLPTIEELKHGWFEKMLNEKPDDLLTMFRKTECIGDLMNEFPAVGESLRKNKAFIEKYQAVLELNDVFRNYMKKYHGIDPGDGAVDVNVTMNVSKDEKTKMGMDEAKSAMNQGLIIGIADRCTPKQKDKKNKIGRKRRRMLRRQQREKLQEEARRKEEEARKKDLDKDKDKDKNGDKNKKELEEQERKRIEQEEKEKKKKELELLEEQRKKEAELKKKREEEERIKREEAQKKVKKKVRDETNNEGTKLIVISLPDGSEEWHYTRKNQKEHIFIKKEPKDVKEAIALRKAVLNISEVEKMDEFAYPIFEHYDTYIKNWAKNNDVSTLVDPKILEKKDLTGLDLEAIGLLRNEILGLGFIETDLNGKLLEVYNYYSDAIKNLIKTDRTLDVEIVQHDKRQTVNYKLSLNTNLDKEYEMQHPSSNDCWSCAGVGIFNHFIRNEKGYLNHKQTQADFRNIKMDYVPQKESNLDNETYLKRLTDIEDFTTNNHSTDRRHTPMGDPYVTADFYLDRLRKIPGYENSAVRKSVFNFIAADSYVKGVGGQGSAVKKDTNAVHNLTEYFKKTVADALAKDSAIAMLLGKHYVTITGIDGDMLKIRDSNNSTRTTMKLSDVTEVDAYSRPVELVWLEKIQDPAATAGTFSTLDYDKETGTFASNGRMREVGSYEEEIAHKKGVGAWRTVDDKDSDISVFVSEAIYVPKTFMGAKKK